MSRPTQSLVAALVLGQIVGSLGWLDPLFIPLVLAGPLVTGAIAGARQVRYAWIALLWCSAGRRAAARRLARARVVRSL